MGVVLAGSLATGILTTASARAAQPSIRNANLVTSSPWTQFRYDSAADGLNTAETALNTSNVGSLKLAWKFQTNGSIYGGNPAVVNGTVFVGSQGGGVYALNETNGAVLWQHQTGGLVDGAPVVSNGIVYFSSFDSNVYAYDAVTGAPKWTFASAGPVEGGMNMAGGFLYAASLSPTQTGPGTVYKLDPATGTPVWSTTAGGPYESSPAVANGFLYIGSEDKSLHVFDTTNGNQVWTFPVSSAVDSSPAVSNGVVYFGADNGNEYAVNTTTHAQVWTFHTGRFLESSAGISGNILVIGSADNNIYGLNRTTGALLWTTTTALQIESSPAVANGFACIGSRDTHMRCLDITNGNVLYTSNFATRSSNSSPAIADGMVFMGSNDHFMYAYSLGSVTQTVPDPPTNVAAMGGDHQATVTWNAPANNGGAPIDHYTVTSNPGGLTATWNSGPLQATITGLTDGTAYTFTVTAHNSVGTSNASQPSNSVTPAAATIPNPPTGATATAGNAQATVSWTAPVNNGGASIDHYTVTSSPDGKTAITPDGSTLNATVLGLTNGTLYTFTVTAHNSVGNSNTSAASNGVTPSASTVPGQPLLVTAKAAAGHMGIVTWSAPSSDGGSSITSYTVTSSPGNLQVTVNGSTFSATITGLIAHVTYTFTVVAANINGPGPPSAPSNPITPR